MSSRLDPIALAVDKSGDNHNIDWEPTGRSSLDLLRRERPRRPSARVYLLCRRNRVGEQRPSCSWTMRHHPLVFVAHWRVAVPTLTRLAVLWDEAIGTLQFHAIETAARSSGVTLESFPIRTAEEINDVVERAAQRRVDGMIVLTSPLIFNQRSQIADLALKARLPTINGFNLYPKTGGLMAYGPNFPSMFKQAASYVDRILSGANPGELPIERPTKFELVINIKTAKALGLKVPWQLQQLADEVIE